MSPTIALEAVADEAGRAIFATLWEGGGGQFKPDSIQLAASGALLRARRFSNGSRGLWSNWSLIPRGDIHRGLVVADAFAAGESPVEADTPARASSRRGRRRTQQWAA